jgi:hypothetical protein
MTYRVRHDGLPGRAQLARLTAGWRAVIWPTYLVVSVPVIIGIRGTLASEPRIFIQAIVPPERAHMPQVVCGSRPGHRRGRAGDEFLPRRKS